MTTRPSPKRNADSTGRATTDSDAGRGRPRRTSGDESGDHPAPVAKSARGERARARLKKAALAVMEREGYHRMRIADVTEEAGVAQGLFYHYFSDLKSLTLEVLEDFIDPARDVEDIEKDVPRGDWYAQPPGRFQLREASRRHALPAADG